MKIEKTTPVERSSESYQTPALVEYGRWEKLTQERIAKGRLGGIKTQSLEASNDPQDLGGPSQSGQPSNVEAVGELSNGGRASVPNMTPTASPLDITALSALVGSLGLPGFVVRASANGRVVYERAFGTTWPEGDVPFRSDAICWLASVSKPVTATAVMVLADRGLLDVDAPAQRYLGDCLPGGAGAHDDRDNQIRVRDLLSHTSGLPMHPAGWTAHFDRDWFAHTLADVVKMSSLRQVGRRGSWRYSNLGYLLLGRIVENVSRVPFGTFLHEAVFQPLQMFDTFSIDMLPEDRIAEFASVLAFDGTVHKQLFPATDLRGSLCPFPAGGIFTTARDLDRFMQTFLDIGGSGCPGVLSPHSLDRMLSDYARVGELKQGLGWVLDRAHGRDRFWHVGSCNVLVMGDRTQRWSVIIMGQCRIDDRDKHLALQPRLWEAAEALAHYAATAARREASC